LSLSSCHPSAWRDVSVNLGIQRDFYSPAVRVKDRLWRIVLRDNAQRRLNFACGVKNYFALRHSPIRWKIGHDRAAAGNATQGDKETRTPENVHDKAPLLCPRNMIAR